MARPPSKLSQKINLRNVMIRKVSIGFIIVLSLFVLGMSWFYENKTFEIEAKRVAPKSALNQSENGEWRSLPEREERQAPNEIDELVKELSERLRHQFSETIHLVAVQVSLKSLRDDLLNVYPEEGFAVFKLIIKTAFPQWLDAILDSIALMDQYDSWLQDVMLTLNDMNPLEQQGMLWEKRRALFGDAALQIWQAEISAEQERQLTMRRTMEMLNKSHDIPMQERLYLLKQNFAESYADKIETMMVDPKGVMAQVFFGFDAVQKDLAKLAPDQRQLQINEIRRSLGFTEEQITHQAEADLEREKRWQNGYAYMKERARVEKRYKGEQLIAELDKLREKFFAHEAVTIKKEEEELAFFRYKRPRYYGRN